jgi:hypothetical protein
MVHADGQTDMTKLIVFFEILRNRLKMAAHQLNLG